MEASDKFFLGILLTLALAVVVIEGGRKFVKGIPNVPLNAMPDTTFASDPWWTANNPVQRDNDNRIPDVGMME